MLKIIKLSLLLWGALLLSGCHTSGQSEPLEETIGEREERKIEWEEQESGTVIYYGKKTNSFYQVTQLPFPTFWGGEAYSIITPEGDLYLVDGGFQGEDGERVARYIEEHGGKVKGWILTHPHVDHIGAFLDYMKENSGNVEKVYYSPFTREFFEEEKDPEIYNIINNPRAILFYEFLDVQAATAAEVEYIPLKAGDRLLLGELELECFASFDASRRDVNANSLVFTLSYEDFTLLLTGDMTEATLEDIKLTADARARIWQTDIIQIPHHGYMAGIASDALYQATSPQYALLDCTLEEYENNSVNIQNHVAMLEQLGIKVIKRFTSTSGNRIVLFAGEVQ
ncbi:MAG: ComEC/Rec2 family competence protein [Lachnospiraceae bacterium]